MSATTMTSASEHDRNVEIGFIGCPQSSVGLKHGGRTRVKKRRGTTDGNWGMGARSGEQDEARSTAPRHTAGAIAPAMRLRGARTVPGNRLADTLGGQALHRLGPAF